MFRAQQAPVVYWERFHPGSANLQFLSGAEFEIAAVAKSQSVSYPSEEALLILLSRHYRRFGKHRCFPKSERP